MNKGFSVNWKKSKQPRKQRKYRYKAPLHIKQKFVRAHLSAELRKKYGTRSFSLKKGDKVNIIRGQFKKKTGKVERVDLKKERVCISGIDILKKDGTKTTYPIHPSNVLITEIESEDKMRKKIIERKNMKRV